jgi:hypothetical protein
MLGGDPIVYAALNGHEAIVDILLDMVEADEGDQPGPDVQTVISAVTHAGYVSIARKLAQAPGKKKDKIIGAVEDFIVKMNSAIEHQSEKSQVSKLLREYFITCALHQFLKHPTIARHQFSALARVIVYAVNCGHPEIIDEMLDLLIEKAVLGEVTHIFSALPQEQHEYYIVLCEHLLSRPHLCSCNLFTVHSMMESASDEWGQLTEQEMQHFEAIQEQLENRAQQCQSREEAIAQLLTQRHGESRMPAPLDLSRFSPK